MDAGGERGTAPVGIGHLPVGELLGTRHRGDGSIHGEGRTRVPAHGCEGAQSGGGALGPQLSAVARRLAQPRCASLDELLEIQIHACSCLEQRCQVVGCGCLDGARGRLQQRLRHFGLHRRARNGEGRQGVNGGAWVTRQVGRGCCQQLRSCLERRKRR